VKRAGLKWGIVIATIVAVNVWLATHQFEVMRFYNGGFGEAWANIAPKLQDFLTLLLSVIVEALPFIILGVLVSVLVQRFVSTEKLFRYLPKNTHLRRIILSFLGVFLPVCECGNVPVARGLMAKGLSVPEAVTFLLAAPVINPITILATWEAFSFDRSITIWRVVGAFLVAQLIGLALSYVKRPERVLTDEFQAYCKEATHTHRSWKYSAYLYRDEMWLMLRMLVLGAVIAAATQVFIPRDILATVGGDPILSIIAMLLLGFIISICSSMDAFFALAYAKTFTSGSIVSFLVAGPMVDIKMLALLKTTFRLPFLIILTAAILIGSFGVGLLVNYG